MRIYIIASALPPQLDGIGDYTAQIAAELAHSAAVTILTGEQHPALISGVRIETAFSADAPASVRRIARYVEAGKPEWVLLQYNPFCYGRWGLNLHLPEMLRSLRRVSPATRLAVMVHEPFVPCTSWKFAIMAIWQRWQLWQLGKSADIIFFSIEAWAKKFASWFPAKMVRHLPVGSNIPVVAIRRAEARARLGIDDDTLVLGLFGTAGSGRMLHRVRETMTALRTAGVPAKLLYLGPDKAVICNAFGRLDVIAEGPLPADEVSRRFSAMDIYLAAYEDGVSTRRGAFLAALQHGIATVGTRGPLTDTLLERENGQAFLLADAPDAAGFQRHVLRLAREPALRERISLAGARLSEKEFTWPGIAQKLQSALGKV